MGMYDYLGGEQIKIFYTPIFESKDIITGKPGTWHSGGGMRSFNEGDKLPLKTLYYKYPDNFVVFDYEYSNNVWIIENGRFKELKNYDDLIKKDLGDAVYDYCGDELNIKTVEDFQTIKKDFQITEKLYNKLENELFPKGLFETIETNITEYNKKRNQLEKIRESTWGEFRKKWYIKDKYYLEKQFGELLECYLLLFADKDSEIFEWYNPKQRYLDCKKALKDFIQEHEGIVERYIKWLDDESLISTKRLKDIVTEILT